MWLKDNSSLKDFTIDELAINQAIEDWEKAHSSKDLNLAIKHYSDHTNWSNAFGVRIHSKEELREFLMIIFNMDYELVGQNNYKKNQITFINDKTASVWSKNVKTNQKWANGSEREDSYINHLRVFQKNEGIWKITNHIISQACFRCIDQPCS